ncbi:DUF1566 domain-containing protein [Spongiivirga citrea]|uniref:DUF1566 domain-containing protein n=1 Tax=Spongiivirga citrea TaxID=1481457 RepID=A0A6M0CK50_9FLAO|nr:DUF1566 domain-containing protein [Spongiivirga citrea]NER18316.1 hypothetical protein [Spongiivirga citrea]
MKNAKNHLSVYVLYLFIFSISGCNQDSTEQPLDSKFLIGETGPGGGIIFYDKGEISRGWRYIEVAPSNLRISEWGCFSAPITDARNLELGTGLANTEAIVLFHDALNDFYNNPSVCSEESNGTVAAKLCQEYSNNGFNDWFLPSEEESFLMYKNLHLNGIGGFEDNLYWTSSEHDFNTATATDFSNGDQGWLCKQCGIAIVRPVRYF